MVHQVAPTVVGDSTARASWLRTAVLRLAVKSQGTGADGLLSASRAEKRSWQDLLKSLLGAACPFEHMVEQVSPPVVTNLAVRTGTLLPPVPMHASMYVHLLQRAEGLTAVCEGANQLARQ